MSIQQQQAVILPSPKAPFVIGPRDIPASEHGEVLIKIMSAALNPVNWAQQAFGLLVPEYPVVLGCDIAGVVEALGEGVEGFEKGDKVFAGTLDRGFQQYVTVPAALLIRIPDNASFDDVSTLPVTFSTACVGLFAPAPIGINLNPTFSWNKPQQGESALVIGGSTSVGQFVIQLLRFLGFTRIMVYASKTHFDYLRQLGATECIDRTEVSLDSLAAHITAPVKVAYDATFTGALNAAYDCLLDGGSIVTAQPRAMCDREGKKFTLVHAMGYIASPEALKFKGDLHGYFPEHATFGQLIIKNLTDMLARGAIVGNRCEVLPNGLAGIPAGLERFGKGAVSGVKLVAHPQDSVA
ncbi:chaperonin 10-like protein [Mycena latifolia]|nr:chaperonin 10-like protein [Mycena latifolia]